MKPGQLIFEEIVISRRGAGRGGRRRGRGRERGRAAAGRRGWRSGACRWPA